MSYRTVVISIPNPHDAETLDVMLAAWARTQGFIPQFSGDTVVMRLPQSHETADRVTERPHRKVVAFPNRGEFAPPEMPGAA